MDGDVGGGYLGLDYRTGRGALAGVAISHGRSDAGYEIDAVTAGEVDLQLTNVLPYASWSPRAGLGVWGLLGAGRGALGLEDEAGEAETAVEMRMAAAGLRRDVVTWREIDVALKADVFLAELKTEAVPGSLPKAAGDAERLRLRLEGRGRRQASSVPQITPILEVGGRWDGGTAENGLGVETGGGLAYSHPGLGLEVEVRGRLLLAHRESAFDEWGGGLTVELDPGQPERGPRLGLASGWGASGSRVAQTWDSAEGFARPPGRAAEPSLERLDLEAGYGLTAPGGTGLLTPHVGLSMAGSEKRGYRLGARLEVGGRVDLGMEGRRSARSDGPAAYSVLLHGRLHW